MQFDEQIVYTDAKVTYVLVGSIYDDRDREEPDRSEAARITRASRSTACRSSSRSRGSRATARASSRSSRIRTARSARASNSELKGIDNVTIYTFLYPIDQLHPDAARKSKMIWCALDPVKRVGPVLRVRGAAQTTTATATIRSPRPTRSGRSCASTATPTLVFADGSVVPGALPAQRSEAEIVQGEAEAQARSRRRNSAAARPGRSRESYAMAIIDFLKKQFIDIIEWTDDSRDTLSFRFPDEDKEIKNGAQLIVRESQVAQFVYLGEFGDTFGPGKHTLTTDNIPILTNLKGWKYALREPVQGRRLLRRHARFSPATSGARRNPVMMRDADFGIVRLRAYGTYDFRVVDPKKFLKEVAGTDDHFRLDEFADTMRSRIVSVFTDALARREDPGARRRVALRRARRGAAAAHQSGDRREVRARDDDVHRRERLGAAGSRGRRSTSARAWRRSATSTTTSSSRWRRAWRRAAAASAASAPRWPSAWRWRSR